MPHDDVPVHADPRVDHPRVLHGTDASTNPLRPVPRIRVGSYSFPQLSPTPAAVSARLTLPWWRLTARVLDLGVPFGLLLLHYYSPTGALCGLGVALLVAPIVIMLSILRLRPGSPFCRSPLAARRR